MLIITIIAVDTFDETVAVADAMAKDANVKIISEEYAESSHVRVIV